MAAAKTADDFLVIEKRRSIKQDVVKIQRIYDITSWKF
jgi:hypothetical protein